MTSARLERCNNIADLRAMARRRLPSAVFDFLEGGAEDEETLRRSLEGFSRYMLVPEVLVDVGMIDTRTRVLGMNLEWPVLLSPTGASRFFHRGGEPAVARAAARQGTAYALSTMSTCGLEEVAAASDGPKIFQLYVFRDRGLTRSLVERAKAAGYRALYLTVDLPVGGNRERDKASGIVMPPKPTLKSWASILAKPAWSFDAAFRTRFGFPSFDREMQVAPTKARDSMQFANSQFDRTITWKEVEWLAGVWGGPLAIKGLSSPGDARKALDCGADAIVVSNHGGRQLDGAAGAINCLPAIRDAVGAALQLVLDGGIRRGSHVLKALALGADACSIGRPYLYGLAAGGEAGVDRALVLLRSELERDMALMGLPDLKAIGPRHVRPA